MMVCSYTPEDSESASSIPYNGEVAVDVRIRKFEQRDIENKIKWINDENNNQYLHYDLPLEYDKTLAWFEKVKQRTDRYDAVIEVDGKPVGIIGLLNIDYRNLKAEYYITLGEQEYKGKGVATRASYLLLDYAFYALGLRKIYLFTETENYSAQKLFKRLGFEKEGVLWNDLRIGDRFVHRYVYGLLKENYTNQTKIQSKLRPHFDVCFTPIVKSRIQENGNSIFIKRDDLLPFSFGGNKARKGALFLREIINGGFDCVVTYGTSSSNHCRVIANIAASQGLPCYIVSPEEASHATSNSRMIALLKATVILTSLSEVSNTIDQILEELRSKGLNPYFIQGGGHGNLGTQAYVNCFREIVKQEQDLGVHFDYVFCASGTGTTQAGLICGNSIFACEKTIVGISVARRNPQGARIVADSVAEYMESNGFAVPDLRRAKFVDEFVVNGYGSFNEEIKDTIRYVLEQDGIPLDTTYTGKAFWGMREYLKTNGITGKNVLFLHTGGTPLFFDSLDILFDEDGT